MTAFLEVDGGRLGYEVTGDGPLVVLVHGMGDSRRAYRFLIPRLVTAGYRVANLDLRGHGDSTTGWSSYTRTDTAGDILALIRRLGGPAVVVGHSFAGGSATIAAAREPELVSAVVEIGPFTRAQRTDLGALFRSVGLWKSYLSHAYPGAKPADFADYLSTLEGELRGPGRMAVVTKMGMSAPTDAGALLGRVSCPALVLMGTLDPDWNDPRAEADGVVAGMPAGLGRVVLIEGAGHYPHAQFPDDVATAMLRFLKERSLG
jgi:pimeloyl-ACP methyl ester carboxylesterase